MIPKSVSWTAKTLFLLFICTWLGTVYQQHFAFLPRATYITGWVLFALMLLLTLYNGRKKIPFLPLLKSRTWLEFHIFAGYLTFALFLAHVRFRIPSGKFECTLAVLYLVVMVSGIIGFFISRSFPKRLTTRGGEIIFEQIPIVRRNLHQRAEALALKSVSDVHATTLADFYVAELSEYFSRSRNFWQHLFEVRSPRNRRLKKIEDLNRFLNEKERKALLELSDMVRQKDGLDYHYSLQMTLKIWLFVHIPITYSLLIFSLVHLVLVYAFSGGA